MRCVDRLNPPPMADEAEMVRRLLVEYVSSPSLKHIRNHRALSNLAAAVVSTLNRNNTAWQKWTPTREQLVIYAGPCWVPIDALMRHLNSMPGPKLTRTDVAQRMRDLQEQNRCDFAREEVRESCEELFNREQAEGTELPAIVGALQEHVESELERLQAEHWARWKAAEEEKRSALEQRFLSGADCKWTPVAGSKDMFCRSNGRAYRLTRSANGQYEMNRAGDQDDPGIFIGRYKGRGDATKALLTIAFAPDLS